MQVSVFSIVFMAISAIISIGLPIALFIYIRKKHNAKYLPLIFGALAFIIFVLVLESLIHSLVFKAYPLKEHPLAYIIYGIFMAGVFEETARFISFKILLRKKYSGVSTGLSYGIGHGGIESALLAGVSMIVAIVFCILINTGNIDVIIGKMQGKALDVINSQINTLTITAPYMFLVSGLERVFAIVIQISLSMIVFYSVYSKDKIWLFPLAILIHAITDIPAAAMQVGVIKSIVLVEGLAGLSAVIVAVIAVNLHRNLKE